MKRIFSAVNLFVLVLLSVNSIAQLSVSTNKTATQLANALVGPGVTVSNATLSCAGDANGTFVGGSGALGIGQGIVLTSGNASSVAAPATTFASPESNNLPGDADLSLLSGNATNDACVLQFDFVPNGDAVQFRYQFGSEEYPSYTCTDFNDVFGFFISGPGYLPNTNIALVPGTSPGIPVAINSVNGGLSGADGPTANCTGYGQGSPFTGFFINHAGSSAAPVYDGLTTVFIAQADVTPCQTYHFKLGVADATDNILSSGVFLEEGSLSVQPPSISGCPAPINVATAANATSCGRTVTWAEPTAANNCLNVTVNQSHHPGDFFPVGTTTVTYDFTNAGGTSSCSFNVTVTDGTPPMISCPASVTVSCDESNAPANTGSATATDNCTGAITIGHTDISTQHPNPNNVAHYNYVINRTWTATDGSNNSSSCNQVITVQDITDPTAACKDVTVTLDGGTASITPADVDDNSSDNCGPVTMSVSPNTFSCTEAGSNVTVVLTVTDVSGNTATCNASVTVDGVQPNCSISVTPADNTYTGGVATNIYLGYGPQSATLHANASGGSGFTYSWAGPTGSLSCTNCADPVFTPTTGGTYTFEVTATNSNGCFTTCSVTFCVKDIREPGKKNKVFLCHVPPGNPGNAHTLSVSVNAVPSHLGNHVGDQLGKCGQTCGTPVLKQIASGTSAIVADENMNILVFPNPSKTEFQLRIESNIFDHAEVAVYDIAGKLIETKTDQKTNVNLPLGGRLAAGVYFVEVRNGEQTRKVKIVKL